MKNVIAEHFKDNLKFGNLFFVNLYRKLPNTLKEYSVYFLSIFSVINTPKCRFLIFAQGRTGSTLLVDLLNSHPEVFSLGEILSRTVINNVKNPTRFANGLMTLNKKTTRGFKVKVYQISREQNKIPSTVLKSFYDDGWKIIYLHRDNFFLHAISDLRSEKTKTWHHIKGPNEHKPKKVHIEYDELWDAITHREKCQKDEIEALDGIEYFSMSYEEDLVNSEKQSKSMKKLLKFLNLREMPLDTKLQKIVKGKLNDNIENFDQLEKKLNTTRFSHFLK